MIQEVVQFLRSHADGEHALSSLEGFLIIGDLPGLIEVEIAVTHEFRMHSEILQVRFGNEDS